MFPHKYNSTFLGWSSFNVPFQGEDPVNFDLFCSYWHFLADFELKFFSFFGLCFIYLGQKIIQSVEKFIKCKLKTKFH